MRDVKFAQQAPLWHTKIEASASRVQVLTLLERYGIPDAGFFHGQLIFWIDNVEYRIRPDVLPVQPHAGHDEPTEAQLRQAERQAWRFVHEYVEGVLAGTWFMSAQQAFLPFLALPGGQTLREVDPSVLTGNVLPAPPPDDDALDVKVTVHPESNP